MLLFNHLCIIVIFPLIFFNLGFCFVCLSYFFVGGGGGDEEEGGLLTERSTFQRGEGVQRLRDEVVF